MIKFKLILAYKISMLYGRYIPMHNLLINRQAEEDSRYG